MAQGIEPLIERFRHLLGPFAEDHGFTIELKDEQPEAGRAWVRLESAAIVLNLIRDRGEERFEVTAKERPGQRKPRRSWPIGHIVAFLDQASDPYGSLGFEAEAEWLTTRSEEILDPEILNSEALNRWAVKASRRMCGKDRRG